MKDKIEKIVLMSRDELRKIDIPIYAINLMKTSKLVPDKYHQREGNIKVWHCEDAYIELLKQELEKSVINRLLRYETGLSIIEVHFKDGSVKVFCAPRVREIEEFSRGGFGGQLIALYFKTTNYWGV